jgi:hypothetical protein
MFIELDYQVKLHDKNDFSLLSNTIHYVVHPIFTILYVIHYRIVLSI